MAIARAFVSIAVLSGATLATSAWAADAVPGAQAQPTNPGMGMGMHAGTGDKVSTRP